jgi:hypothetical protein
MLRHAAALVLCVLLPLASGCAPDAMSNRQAGDFDVFLDRIARECRPLSIGRYQMSERIEHDAINDDYIYFLDQTSRLYYGTISPATYRTSIDAFFLGGSTSVAVDCIVSRLPPNR